MKKGIAKFTALCMTAGLTFAESATVFAERTDSTLVGLKDYSAAETSEENNTADEAEETITENNTIADEVQEQAALDTSMVGTTGFAQCSEYVNVRSSADTDGDVVGKIYNNGSMEILGVDEYGWYHVVSGNVEGYIASQYVATGASADTIAQSAGYTTAEVGAEVLNVRASADSSSDVVATVTESSQLEVVEDNGDWVKVCIDANTYGYVSSDYVYTSTQYATGYTVEEESYYDTASYTGEDYGTYETYDTADYSYTDNSYTAVSYDYSASDAQSVANAKYQTYLNAQAAADAAVTGGDEQTIYDTAAAATAAYQDFLTAQNAADEAAYGSAASYTSTAATYMDYSTSSATYTTSSGSSVEEKYQAYLDAQAKADAATTAGDEQAVYDTAAAATAAYQEYLTAQNAADEAAYASASYTDNTSSESTYTESYTEESYTEDTTSSVSYSSVGQQIADYACQFVGNPYVWGGSSLTGGADCSGFTMAVMANFGIGLPHNAAAQSGYGTAVDLGSIQPGDLLFYNGDGGIGHVSIYIGNGQVVHASNPTNGIIISSYSYRTPCCARRFV